MNFTPSLISGAFIIETEPRNDARGFFARVFCEQEFTAKGLVGKFAQISESSSVKRGTLRGMHYQLGLAAEVKLVRCLRGEVYDVVLDLRPKSPTFGQSFGTVLSAENWKMMYVPRGCAHGFISLSDNSDLLYMISDSHSPEFERGVRYNDPRFKIKWPIELTEISDKDRTWPDFSPAFHFGEQA